MTTITYRLSKRERGEEDGQRTRERWTDRQRERKREREREHVLHINKMTYSSFAIFRNTSPKVGTFLYEGNIGVGRGRGGKPPNNLRGGAFSFNFHVKQEKIINVPSCSVK